MTREINVSPPICFHTRGEPFANRGRRAALLAQHGEAKIQRRPGRVAGGDAAAMGFDDGPADREAEAPAVGLHAAARGEEGAGGIAEARAGVGDRDFDIAAARARWRW